MPTITANFNHGHGHGPIYARGENATDRPLGDRRAPSINVRAYAPELYAHINAVNQLRRSPWACAEAQALSKLLWFIRRAGYAIDLSRITFGRPTGYDGAELWSPCDNCQEWLEQAGGWGPDVTYRIRMELQ